MAVWRDVGSSRHYVEKSVRIVLITGMKIVVRSAPLGIERLLL
jgi:hypothetical protein